MKQFILLLFCLTCLTCCDNEDSIPTCEFSDPLEELSWLKEYKESLQDCQTETSIFQASYKGHVVFYTALTDPLINSAFAIGLWNCEGEIIKTYEYDEREEFHNEVSNIVLLYRCKNSE
jgi:hypothetical protein